MYIQKRLGTRMGAGDGRFWSYGVHTGTLLSRFGHIVGLTFPYSWVSLKSSIGSGMNSFGPPIDPWGPPFPTLSCCPTGVSLAPGLSDGAASLSFSWSWTEQKSFCWRLLSRRDCDRLSLLWMRGEEPTAQLTISPSVWTSDLVFSISPSENRGKSVACSKTGWFTVGANASSVKDGERSMATCWPRGRSVRSESSAEVLHIRSKQRATSFVGALEKEIMVK